MNRIVYFVPYLFWIVVTFILIENSLINDKPHLFSFIITSLIIAFTLEILRNRWLNNNSQLSRNRLISFLIINFIIGIPLFFILALISVPLNVTGQLGISYQLEYANWQQYLGISYCLIWFVTNAILLKPRNMKGLLMFCCSVVIMGISSIIFGLLMSFLNAEINLN